MTPNAKGNEFIDCPCCDAGGIRVHYGKIDRHEYGLRYFPYRWYHAQWTPSEFKAAVKRNLCPASGKTEEQANGIFNNFMKPDCHECQKDGKCPKQEERESHYGRYVYCAELTLRNITSKDEKK